MLATLAGFLALLLGLSLLLLPLLVSELSRPRDSAWGAVVLLLGLVLVTSSERLTGAPMLAVLCGGLLVGRLGSEVAQGRWRALTDEERQALRSSERWSRSLSQLAAVVASLLQTSLELLSGVSAWLGERRQGRSHGKRWVRAETASTAPVAATTSVAGTTDAAEPAEAAAPDAADAALSDESAPLESPEPTAEGPPTASFPASSGGVDAAAGPAREMQAALASDPQASPVVVAPVSQQLPASDATAGTGESAAAPPAEPLSISPAGDPGVRVVADFEEVDALLAAASEPAAARDAVASAPASAEVEHAEQPAPDASAGSSAELS